MAGFDVRLAACRLWASCSHRVPPGRAEQRLEQHRQLYLASSLVHRQRNSNCNNNKKIIFLIIIIQVKDWTGLRLKLGLRSQIRLEAKRLDSVSRPEFRTRLLSGSQNFGLKAKM